MVASLACRHLPDQPIRPILPQCAGGHAHTRRCVVVSLVSVQVLALLRSAWVGTTRLLGHDDLIDAQDGCRRVGGKRQTPSLGGEVVKDASLGCVERGGLVLRLHVHTQRVGYKADEDPMKVQCRHMCMCGREVSDTSQGPLLERAGLGSTSHRIQACLYTQPGTCTLSRHAHTCSISTPAHVSPLACAAYNSDTVSLALTPAFSANTCTTNAKHGAAAT